MSDPDLLQRITIDPQVCHGAPCVRGLRHPADFLLDLLSREQIMDEAQILKDYPDLEAEDLKTVYAHAARLSRVEQIEPNAA